MIKTHNEEDKMTFPWTGLNITFFKIMFKF